MRKFTIATWNVNSLRVRLAQVLDWLAVKQPDLLALQETKTQDDQFPMAEIRQAGYYALFNGQKTYNGVALLSRAPIKELGCGFSGFTDPQRRVLIAEAVGGVCVLNLYVPNGSEPDSEKYSYKLEWMRHLRSCAAEMMKKYPCVVLLGDFNVAPEDRDVHDPAAWEGRVLISNPERAAFQSLLDLGFFDCFRRHCQEPGMYTWWDYRGGSFRRNHGLRIDHILASADLAETCGHCEIDVEPRGNERPSDHCPVIAEFALNV
ncbi:MAG: exodeoxyribonuclease III [Candidatus Eutrophobiaceae bacterium]